MANDTFNMLEEDAFAVNPPEVAATLADYNDPVVGAQSQPANTTKEERDIADAQVAEETFTDAYMEKADREMRMAADANVARQNQTRREADAKVAGEAIDVVAQAGNQTVADAQAKEREKQRAEAQRLASGVTRHQDETTLLLKANMAKLKAKERADNEAKGYVASGGGIAGETGRRRRIGEAPLRLTPQETFDATNKINKLLQAKPGETVTGVGLTDLEVNAMRDDLGESLAGRKFLDIYDSKKRDFENEFNQVVDEFNTMEDVTNFLDSFTDPYVSDYARNYVAQNITEETLRRFDINLKNMTEAEVERQKTIQNDMDTFKDTKLLAEADKLSPETRKGEHRGLYYFRRNGRWERRESEESKKLVKQYKNAKALGRSVEDLMVDALNFYGEGGQRQGQVVFGTYKEETGGQMYEGDGVGFVYDETEVPEGVGAVTLTDDETTKAYNAIIDKLNDAEIGSGKSSNITWAIKEYVEENYGDDAVSTQNELGKQIVQRLEDSSGERKNSFDAWKLDSTSGIDRALEEEDKPTSAADRAKDGRITNGG